MINAMRATAIRIWCPRPIYIAINCQFTDKKLPHRCILCAADRTQCAMWTWKRRERVMCASVDAGGQTKESGCEESDSCFQLEITAFDRLPSLNPGKIVSATNACTSMKTKNSPRWYEAPATFSKWVRSSHVIHVWRSMKLLFARRATSIQPKTRGINEIDAGSLYSVHS